MPLLMQILKDHIYDTAFLPENMPNDRAYLFQIPYGQYAGRKIKMLEHTNLPQNGMMPAPEKFSIREVKCAFYQAGEYLEPPPGVLHMERYGKPIRSFALSHIADENCKSLICTPPCDYPEDFREYEDVRRPIIEHLESQEHFCFVLELPVKPELPTEFVVVLGGDHYVAVREVNPARR